MNKTLTGKLAHLAGANAEFQVAADYTRRGHRLVAQRWRSKAGEVDLIFNNDGDEVIFVEVKKARIFQMLRDAFQRVSNSVYVSRQKNI